MSKGIVVDIILFDYTIRGKCFQFQPFQRIVKSGREIWQTALSTCILYKSSIEHDIDLLVIVLPIVQFTLFKCNNWWYASKNWENKGFILNYFKACFQVMTTKK